MNEILWQNINLQQARERIGDLENVVVNQIINLKKLIEEKLQTETEGPATYYVNYHRDGEDIEIGCIKEIYKIKEQFKKIKDIYLGYYVYVYEDIDIEDDEPENFEGRNIEDIFMVINNNLKSSPEYHKDYSIEYKVTIKQQTKNGFLNKDIIKIKIKQSFVSSSYRGFSVEWIPLQKEKLSIFTDYNSMELIKVGQYYVDKKGSFYTEEQVFNFR